MAPRPNCDPTTRSPCSRRSAVAPEEYRTFVEVYGYDIMKWDGYEALAILPDGATWQTRGFHRYLVSG